MPLAVAILLCSIGVATLFYLDRDKSTRNSKALWIPVIWISLVGSRPVSDWFGLSPANTPSANLDGSPLDAAIFAALLAIGVVILAVRGRGTRSYLTAMAPVLLYFAYCLVSVAWSPVPVPSLKRWTKDIGDLVMVLVIVTDPQPLEALRRLYSRVGFILFPISLTLIRFSDLGRSWDNDGNLYNVGVTTNKNTLGLTLFVISLGVLWNCRWLLVNKDEPNRRRRLLAQGVLLMLGLVQLNMAHSSTSSACFVLGSGLILATHLRAIKAYPSRVSWLGLMIIIVGGMSILFGDAGDVANALGRNSDFSGRTLIWAALVPTVSSPIIGTGFDSYWNSPNVAMFQSALNSAGFYRAERLNEAHNGYLEVYMNLGWIGVCLVAAILISGYMRACKAFRHNKELGSLMLAYIVTGSIYNITEAGFRTLNACWVFILLAFVSASGAVAGALSGTKGKLRVSSQKGHQLSPGSVALRWVEGLPPE